MLYLIYEVYILYSNHFCFMDSIFYLFSLKVLIIVLKLFLYPEVFSSTGNYVFYICFSKEIIVFLGLCILHLYFRYIKQISMYRLFEDT